MRLSLDCDSARSCSFSVSEKRCSALACCSAAPSDASCASRAPAPAAPASRRLAQRVGQLLLGRGELRAEAVDLLVLVRRDVAVLSQQRLLERRQRLGQLLPRAARAARDLVAQLALDALGLGTHEIVQLVPEAAPGSGVGATQREPRGHQQQQRQQRRREPFESHQRIVAAGRCASRCEAAVVPATRGARDGGIERGKSQCVCAVG